MGERSLWDSRASLSRCSCSTSSWAWVMAGFSQCCTSRPASCNRASLAAPFTWLTWHGEEGSSLWLGLLWGGEWSLPKCVHPLPPPYPLPTIRQRSGGGCWLRRWDSSDPNPEGCVSPVPAGCSASLPAAAALGSEPPALEPAAASAPAAAAPGWEAEGGADEDTMGQNLL